MAKHIHQNLTPEERRRSRRARAAFEAEKDRIVTQGRAVFERHERLQRTLKALKAERKRQGISLAELERRTGITKSALSRLENDPNANPTISTLDRIAMALGKQIRVTLTARRHAA